MSSKSVRKNKIIYTHRLNIKGHCALQLQSNKCVLTDRLKQGNLEYLFIILFLYFLLKLLSQNATFTALYEI